MMYSEFHLFRCLQASLYSHQVSTVGQMLVPATEIQRMQRGVESSANLFHLLGSFFNFSSG